MFIRKDLRRAFCNMGFAVGIGSAMLIIMRGLIENSNLDGSISMYELILNAMALSGFGPFAAIFPVLAYSTSFCGEYRSGYLKLLLSRMSWKKYAATRILTTALAGGMVIALPFAVMCATAYHYGVHGLPQNGMYAGTNVAYYIQHYGDFYVMAGKVILGFLFGAMWALFGMAFAVWSGNKYVTLVAPFVLYEVMWLFLDFAPYLNPIRLYRGDSLDSYPLSAIMELNYIVIAVLLILFGLRRRVNNG